jgi:multicomponent Na+:H+ antiporter subunit B
MIKKSLIFLIVVAFGFIFLSLFMDFTGSEKLGIIPSHYAENATNEVGAANLVTAVVVSYRGLDTLGEVSILFLTAAIIGFILSQTKFKQDDREAKSSGEILQTATKIMVPIIFAFGAYVFINGHLSPGGGFQGGAIIASGVLLMFLANPKRKINHKIIQWVEAASGISFIGLAILGLILKGSFLDNSFLSLGEFGKIFSAGAVPLIYIAVGLKVGAELTSIITNYNEIQKEEE